MKAMTSTLIQQQQLQKQIQYVPISKTTTKSTKRVTRPATATTTLTTTMAWTNEKLRFSCIDNIGLKQLWKLIALDTTTSTATQKGNSNILNDMQQQSQQPQQQHQYQHQQQQSDQRKNQHQHHHQKQQQKQIFKNMNSTTNENLNIVNGENLVDYFKNRDILPPNRMSLLKFFAINALELSAPATPLLLQQKHEPLQQQTHENIKPAGWMQLSGHPEIIVPMSNGIVRKRIASIADSEVHAYNLLAQEPQTSQIVPLYFGTREINGEQFIELQDLLAGFKDPCVMDIKMGCRTFLESEVCNKTLRPDLYKKMIAVDPNAPTAEEHAAQAITKLRYMLFREAMSSSQSRGFRIEALRLRGHTPLKDLKKCRTFEQIIQTIEQFLESRKSVQNEIIQRLKTMRTVMEQSAFFKCHEIVGSSIFIVFDNEKVGAWLIDFAKSRQLPQELTVNHRSDWLPGNREEGLLKGMDELIAAFEEVQSRNTTFRNYLQI